MGGLDCLDAIMPVMRNLPDGMVRCMYLGVGAPADRFLDRLVFGFVPIPQSWHTACSLALFFPYLLP